MPFLYTDKDGQTHLVSTVVGDGLTRFEQEPYTETEPVSIDDSEDE